MDGSETFFVDANRNRLSTDDFIKAFDDALKEQVALMRNTTEWNNFTENYEAKTIDLLADMMASAMTVDVMAQVLEGVFFEHEKEEGGRGERASRNGRFIETSILGLPASPNPNEDIQAILGDDKRRIEVKASTFHNQITVGGITVYGMDESAISGDRIYGEGSPVFSDIRNITALYKVASKMNNLLVWMLEEIQKNSRSGFHIKSIILFSVLIFSKLKEYIVNNRVVTIQKSGSYNPDTMSQAFSITINIKTEKAFQKLVEMYARKADITNILHRVNSDLGKRALVKMIKYEGGFPVS